jgi:hypothetical protein
MPRAHRHWGKIAQDYLGEFRPIAFACAADVCMRSLNASRTNARPLSIGRAARTKTRISSIGGSAFGCGITQQSSGRMNHARGPWNPLMPCRSPLCWRPVNHAENPPEFPGWRRLAHEAPFPLRIPCPEPPLTVAALPLVNSRFDLRSDPPVLLRPVIRADSIGHYPRF